jgi:sugar phosphate isomerase/epimerase
MKSDASPLSRRALLAAGAVLLSPPVPAKEKLKVAVFSKHLQFLAGDSLAAGVAELGFDGLDITVRKGGHVEPAQVSQDLPALAATLSRHGLEVPMVTTDIVAAETPFAEDILKTMARLGIRNYRFGAFKWEARQPYDVQLERMKPRLAKLAALNTKYQACAMYHTHSGAGLVGASIWDLYILMKELDPKAMGVNYDVGHATIEGGLGGWIDSFKISGAGLVGASIWDLYILMKELDPKAMGVNYDVGHATIEGGLGGWIDSFKISGAHLRGIAVKDFLWEQDAKGNWREQWKPIGEGMVRFPQFFAMVAEAGFAGPLQMHYEYPLGGANNGTRKITISREEVFSAMKKDLVKVRGYLGQAGL